MEIELYDAAGVPRPMRMELHESSGPVSPRYQYQLDLVLQTREGQVELCREARGGAASPLAGLGSSTRLISRERCERLWQELLGHDVWRRGVDLIGDKRNRVGVSFNWFELSLEGHPPLRIDYMLSQLEDEANAPILAILESFKGLARE